MVRAGLDAGHALLVGQLLAPFIDLLRQVRHAEQVHIFKAVGLPQLRFLGEDVLGVVDEKVHGGHQGLPCLLVPRHVKAARVHIAQLVNGLLPRHGLVLLPSHRS